MGIASNPLHVESAHATYTTSDSSSALPPSLAVNGTVKADLTRNSNSSSSSSSSRRKMSQQSSQAVDMPEVDDTMSEDVLLTQRTSPVRATAATSGRGRGRGRWSRTKPKVAKVAKPAQPKAAAGRGRRQKVYDSAKAQAAHERVQELKQAFAAVVKSVKPAVQEIADRSINELLEDPTAYEKVPEYATAQKFLRERRDDAIRQCDTRLRTGLDMAEHVYRAELEFVRRSYTVSQTGCAHLMTTTPSFGDARR